MNIFNLHIRAHACIHSHRHASTHLPLLFDVHTQIIDHIVFVGCTSYIVLESLELILILIQHITHAGPNVLKSSLNVQTLTTSFGAHIRTHACTHTHTGK